MNGGKTTKKVCDIVQDVPSYSVHGIASLYSISDARCVPICTNSTYLYDTVRATNQAPFCTTSVKFVGEEERESERKTDGETGRGKRKPGEKNRVSWPAR